MNKKKQATEEPQTSKARPKRAYQKPSFKHEKVFETTALSCGKIDTTQGQCGRSPRAS
jgi:hypothetical protein